MNYGIIGEQDKEVADILSREDARQMSGIELIPSENYVSDAVREAISSTMTNKYAEGYPGKRYYGGQENTDAIESLAIERARQLFKCIHANVQPHAGAQANQAAYFAMAQPGDTIVGMNLSHGGHLSHGHPMTHVAQVFHFVSYGVKDIATGEIDYGALEQIVAQQKPKIVLAGFSSYTRTPDWKKIADIAHTHGAYAMADISHIAGFIATEVMQNPFDAGFDLMTTTTHKTLRGPRGGMILVRDDRELAQAVDKSVFPGMQGGPLMHQIAGKAACFGEALDTSFKEYAEKVLVNAKAMEAIFRDNGVTMIFGGTDNHMILIDTVASFNLSGKEAQRILEEVGITLNMNIIPDDRRPAIDPSGIRLGSPAMTTRGFNEEQFKKTAQIIVNVLKNPIDTVRKEAREEVMGMVRV